MVASHLVVGASIGRPEIKALEDGYVGRDAEREAGEPARPGACARARLAGYVRFNYPILEFSCGQDHKPVLIRLRGGGDCVSHSQGGAPFIRDEFRLDLVLLQTL